MRVTIVCLLITLTVLFNSIDLISSQALRNRIGQQAFRPNYLRVRLPSPYYYDDEHSNGEIRAHGHPNARPLIRDNLLCGMTDGIHFFPIIMGHDVCLINLLTHATVVLGDHEKNEIRRGAEIHIRALREYGSSRPTDPEAQRAINLFSSTWLPPIPEFRTGTSP